MSLDEEWAKAEYLKGMHDRKIEAMNALRDAREMREMWSISPDLARILSEESKEKEKEREQEVLRSSRPYKMGYNGIIIIGF